MLIVQIHLLDALHDGRSVTRQHSGSDEAKNAADDAECIPLREDEDSRGRQGTVGLATNRSRY